MTDATAVGEATEGRGLGAAAPDTNVGQNDSFVASGDDTAKRRRITPQDQVQRPCGNTLNSIQQIITSDGVCANCLNGEHKTEDCPNAGAAEWISMLISVRDGIEARNSMTDTRMHDV